MTLYKTIATADGGCEHVAMSQEEEDAVLAMWAEEESLAPKRAADAVRAERNARLAACDWTQIADAPVNSLSWANYRQALRDIPEQEGFPFTVVWPTEPQ